MIPIPSPLTFARDYAAYRVRATSTPFADSRLLRAVRFWQDHRDALRDSAFESFWREDLPPLLSGASADLFTDLLPDELEEIANFLDTLPSTIVVSISSFALWELAAKAWFYVGDVDRALGDLARAGIGARSPRPVTMGGETQPLPLRIGTSDIDEGEAPGHSSAGSFAGIDAIDIPRFLIDHSALELAEGPGRSPWGQGVVAWLERFDTEWRAQRDGGSVNQAICVLVEHDEAMRPVRGRFRILQGQVEALSGKDGTDHVVFSHQLRAGDDPQISGAYFALGSLKNIPNSPFHTPHSSMRGNFEFLGGDKELYGGDSLAFACFATAYGDWWSKDLHRERRLISANVAFSGALADQGQAAAISDSSLPKKVERIFFSPLSHLVIPESNRNAAEKAVERLRQHHPARRLRVIGVERASDIVADRNIFIPERVCLGEFAVRAAAKYTRSIKVQVPLLAILGYLLLCLLYPKAWVGFDWNPHYARLTTSGFVALNSDSTALWSKSFPCRCDPLLSTMTVGDIDRDHRNEVAYVLKSAATAACSLNATLFVFDNDGALLFQRQSVILGEYLGDTSLDQSYSPRPPLMGELSGGTVIATSVCISDPARCHIQMWDQSGTRRGWYINAGFAGDLSKSLFDPERRRLFIGAYNNRMKCAALAVLEVDSCRGASPPYDDLDYGNLGVRVRGNQLGYILLPRTDLNVAEGKSYNAPASLARNGDHGVRIHVNEGDTTTGGIHYLFDCNLRLISMSFDDTFIARRGMLVRMGSLPDIEIGAYRDTLAAHVQYWTDTGWVSEGQLRALAPQQ